jgi:heterodisulfide reductase subunit A2
LSTSNKKAMVVGGGIAGLTAAWELSQLDINVELIEKTCFLGGHAIQFCCKATDECVTCGACSVEDMLCNVINEPRIKVHLATEVEKINKNGKFSVSMKKSSPQTDGVEGGIAKGYSKNNSPLFVVVDKKSCKDIPDGAVEFDHIELTKKIDDIDAVILASGFKPFNAEKKGTYGYHKFNNIVTGLDLESIIRKNGAVVRPSDGKEPKSVAFIQCVGSRDENLGNLWCSQVCCPYALRMAEQAKYKNADIDITVFYMDIQNTGKNFPVFYEKCKSDMRFVRNIPVDIYPIEDDKLQMRYMNDEDGLPVKEVFDMVVLSIGIMPGSDNKKISELLNIDLNKDGFFACKDKFNRTSTSKDGIFIAGTVQGPKTIAASMAHATQAAGEVKKYLGVS